MREGHKPELLLNIVEEGSGYLASHLVNTKIIEMQSRALGIRLVQRKAISQKIDRKEFEEKVEKYIREVCKNGISGMVVGYTHEDYQRRLLKRISAKHGIALVESLFGLSSRATLLKMVDAGFKAMITEVSTHTISERWLGRLVDKRFIRYLSSLRRVDFCGDYGEYHTVILDGPVFKKRIEIQGADTHKQGNRAVLKIRKCALLKKQ